MKKRNARLLGLLLAGLLVLSCATLTGPVHPTPWASLDAPTPVALPFQVTLPPSLTPVSFSVPTAWPTFTVTPTSPFTATPTFPPTATLTLTASATFTATATSTLSPTATMTLTPTATRTPFPTLTGFGDVLSFGGGGGGGQAVCVAPLYPPPTIYMIQSDKHSQILGLCAYDYPVPAAQPMTLTITAPNGAYMLQGNFQLDASNPNITCSNSLCNYWSKEFSWPAGLPSGQWTWQLSWPSGAASGPFETAIQHPTLTVLDTRAYSDLREMVFQHRCHLAPDPGGLVTAGLGFPPTTLIYLPIYEQNNGIQFQTASVEHTFTDSNGNFQVTLAGPFQSGRSYVIAGLSRPDIQFIVPAAPPYLNEDVIGPNAIDCFTIP